MSCAGGASRNLPRTAGTIARERIRDAREVMVSPRDAIPNARELTEKASEIKQNAREVKRILIVFSNLHAMNETVIEAVSVMSRRKCGVEHSSLTSAEMPRLQDPGDGGKDTLPLADPDDEQ